jgi:hypothetical protein
MAEVLNQIEENGHHAIGGSVSCCSEIAVWMAIKKWNEKCIAELPKSLPHRGNTRGERHDGDHSE